MSLIEILLLAFIAFAMYKGLPVIFEAIYEYQNDRAFDKIKVGSRWMKSDGDPWSDMNFITIVEKLDGWVKYRYDGGSMEHAIKAWVIVDSCKPVERIEEDV